jgi:predicted ArsR family transcriptional regulator
MPIADELTLDDLSLITEITQPQRSALLHRLKRPRSAAELAAELDVPVTRLYHHLNRLEQLGLITVVATRRSGAKTERRYRNVAKSFRLDEAVIDRASGDELATALTSLFDRARNDLRHELESDAQPPVLTRGHSTIGLNELQLTDEQRVEFLARLGQLFDEYAEIDLRNERDQVEGTTRFRLFIAAFRITS